MLYMAALRSIPLQGSAFGAYYRRLVERGLKKGSALTAVMRKMLAVAAHFLRHGKRGRILAKSVLVLLYARRGGTSTDRAEKRMSAASQEAALGGDDMSVGGVGFHERRGA